MKGSAKRLFIFDLDGTLVDAYTAIAKSLNFTLTRFGYPCVSLGKVRKSVGKGDVAFIELFFEPAQVKKALSVYRQHHKRSLRRYSKVKPYARMLLYRLKQKKRLAAVASNRPTEFTHIIVRKLKLDKYIDYILCADRVSRGKPHPEMLKRILKKFRAAAEEAVYVGDMALDVEAARAASIDAVFVRGGSGHPGQLTRRKDTRVISSLEEVLKIYG